MLIILMYVVMAFIIFMCVDTVLYVKAPWPERTKHFYYKLPGGGIVAYFHLSSTQNRPQKPSKIEE